MYEAALSSDFERICKRLQALEDKEQIRQIMYKYARGADRLDSALIATAYHDDAWDDHGTFQGPKEHIVDLISSNPSGADMSTHHLGNMLIELDGERADVETYFLAYQVRTVGEKRVTRLRAGRYLDQFEKRNDKWGIVARTVVDDWNRVDEIVSVDEAIDTRCKSGRRDDQDSSYDVISFR